MRDMLFSIYATHITFLQLIIVVFMGILVVTKGTSKIRPDSPEFGKNLSLNSVLQPLWRSKLPTFNVDLMNQEDQEDGVLVSSRMFVDDGRYQSYTKLVTLHALALLHLGDYCHFVVLLATPAISFLANSSKADQLSFICCSRFFVILKSNFWINLTKFADNRPSVVWRYWLEPAELFLYIDVIFNALMIDKNGNEIRKEVILSGLLDIIISTEFKMCMVHVEFYPHDFVIRDNSTNTDKERDISDEDVENLKDHVWGDWIPTFVHTVTTIVTTRDYCDNWFPPSYYDIIKY